MIQPTPILVRCFALIGIPFMAMTSLGGFLSEISLVALALLVVAILMDALRVYANEPTIEWIIPKKVQGPVGQPLHGKIQIRTSAGSPLFLMPELPPGIQWSAPLETSGEAMELNWSIEAEHRGLFKIERWHYASLSPFRLWRKKARHQQRMELWIYPNLSRERRSLAPFLLKRLWEGEHFLRQNGPGREFDRLREYTVGDSAGDIHWKATARHSKVISKTYQIERNQEVYVILDASRLSLRPSQTVPGFTRLDHAIDATLWLGQITQKTGDRFGIVSFSDRLHDFIRSGTGLSHYQCCRDSLFQLHGRRVSPDFEELITSLRERLRKRALLLFLTALDDPLQADLFQERVRLLTRHHLVHVVMPVESTVSPIFDSRRPLSEKQTPHEALAGHLLSSRLQELRRNLSQQGAKLSLCDEQNFTRSLLQRYLEIKRRQFV